ncbi:MAG: MFS transporter [Deltaproteobacteria bacterium HGW-Deltaproteobacteria-6]|jgi:sugar phosphate permease|nr:MAG: MFS transporter [Deltaproteobacteria bacterium HGW-Deltaproteobacteria-6]
MSFVRYRYLIFGILGAAYILVFFHRLAPAVVAVDMMTDLKTGGALMGILASAYFYPYGLMQIPAGLLSDSWGPRRSIVFFFIIGAVGSMALGFAHTVSAAIAARIVVGLGVAMVFIPTLKILTHWFEREKFVHMSGLLMALGGVGAYTASTPLALMSDAITWRGSMIAIGVLTLVISGLVWLLVRDTPEQAGYPALTNCAEDDTCDGTKFGILGSIFLVIKNKDFWPMALCSFFGSLVSLSFSGLWGGPFLMHVYGMTRTRAGALLSAMAIGMIVGAPVMSWLSNRIFHSRKKVLILSQLGGLLVFAPLAFFTGDFSETALYLWCFFYSFFMSSLVVVGYSAIKDSFPIQISGTATGTLNIFPFAGAALGQPLIGWYLDSAGAVGGIYPVEAYSAAFKICLLSLFAALIASTQVKETFPKKQADA